MSNLRTIRYGITSTGLIVSQVRDEVALWVLDFAAIGQGGDGFSVGDFRGPTRLYLERFPVQRMGVDFWNDTTWTRKVPHEAKIEHRRFWGMPEKCKAY